MGILDNIISRDAVLKSLSETDYTTLRNVAHLVLRDGKRTYRTIVDSLAAAQGWTKEITERAVLREIETHLLHLANEGRVEYKGQMYRRIAEGTQGKIDQFHAWCERHDVFAQAVPKGNYVNISMPAEDFAKFVGKLR
jgi:hypothetical protein